MRGHNLEEMPSRSDPLPKLAVQEESLQSALRLADSAIKQNVTDSMRPTEAGATSFNAFLRTSGSK